MKPIVSKSAVETAYSFFHQKLRVYGGSDIRSQKDDIEYAVSSYVNGMNSALYDLLSEGKRDFLRNHACFPDDMANAVAKLENML